MKKMISVICVIVMLLSLCVVPTSAEEVKLVKEKLDISISTIGEWYEYINYVSAGGRTFIITETEVIDANTYKTILKLNDYPTGTDLYGIRAVELSDKVLFIIRKSGLKMTCLVDEYGELIHTFNEEVYISQLNENIFEVSKSDYVNGFSTLISNIYNLSNDEIIDTTYYGGVYGFSSEGGFGRTSYEDTKYYWIDANGIKTSKYITVDSNQSIYNYVGEGLYILGRTNGDWEYMHATEKAGLIDKNGNIVVPCEYQTFSYFSDGMAVIRKSIDEYGYINKFGEIVIPLEYYNATPFNNGVAEVCGDGENGEPEWFYINKQNEKVSGYENIDYVYSCLYPVRGEEFNEVLTINETGDTFDFSGTGLRAYLFGDKNEYILGVDKDGIWYKLSFTTQNENFSNITFSNQTYTYDGTEKALKVTGILPEGATVTYTNEKGTDVGTYNSKAVIEADGYNTLTLNTTMTITPAPITVKAKDVTIKTGAIIPTFDENSYEITSGKLFGDDKITGTLATNCNSTSVAKDFNITQGTLTAGNNYNLTFVNGKLSVVDKTPQVITVDGIVEKKTYGDDGFKITVTPDATSKLDNFTITSSNANVATVDASGNVTIKGAGITTISVKEAGNAEYAAFEKTWTLTIDKAKVTITADNITKKIGQDDPKLTYTVNGNLYGEDKVSGELTRTAGEEVGKYDILIGTLAISDNYEITFNKGEFEIVDKTPQVITVADIDAKTYGDAPFKLEVTPDATSKLDTFTYASSNVDVADVAADGTVTIKGAGETTITVSQAGNEEYAATEKSVKLVVNPITLTVTTIDMENKTATIEGVLEADKASVELDFDNLKTTVISSEKTIVEEITTITSTLKVTNFIFKGEKANNYVADKAAFLTTTVASTTVTEKLTEDENVTIEAAPVDDKTIIVTDVTVVPEAGVKKVTIDVTAIADTKVNTVALPKTTVDSIVGIDPEATLEITLKDGSDENKESTITLNAQALAAIQTAGASATTISISVDKAETEELAAEQAAKVDEVSTKTPVVYSLSIVDEAGNSVAGSFGDAGKATVTLPYAKPAGNGNVIVKYLDDLGNLTNIANPKYDANNQTVKVELGHFSEYLIYTEPVVSYGGGGGGVSRYTVKFETNGGSTVKAVTVNKNAAATEPTAPTKEGFKFEGWYTDKELTTAYDFTTKVTKNFTLYAKWTEIEKEPEVVEPDTTISFKDVKADDWFYANVQYVVENKLMNGVEEDKFAPNDTLTRAMLVTVLYRNEGEPAVNKSIPFADVDMGAYYANAVSWAKQNGIVNGITENEFAPDANITREQIAAIMFRYAQYKGMDAVTLEENLHFTDSSEISEYAVSTMNWAVGTGLMKGKSATTINPKDNATRAEIAAILQRFIEANK